ncbi:hypothetical protein L1281_000096 [Neisseria sp. HSC-16F19]|nr:hypothetical protein [Neisseria sp. HSC-16F19]MCP2039531.1 hypothetical protein [Neisseria sp. HSC-16F19]
MITSQKIATALNKALWPVLKAQGFQHRIGRSYYRVLEGQVWAVYSAAVGHYFSEITGHPAHAFDVSLCCYHFPAEEQPCVERRLALRKPYWGYLPDSYQELEALDMSVQYREHTRGAETSRTDLWAVAPDGANLAAVLDDVMAAYAQQSPPFWARMGSAEYTDTVLREHHARRGRAAQHREQYEKAVRRKWKNEAESQLRSWLSSDAVDYFAYWDAHGGDPLISPAKAKSAKGEA